MFVLIRKSIMKNSKRIFLRFARLLACNKDNFDCAEEKKVAMGISGLRVAKQFASFWAILRAGPF